jgi:hypothetical protein
MHGAILPAAALAARLVWPLPSDLGLTSGFGDLRENHLHAGDDLSTGGQNGLPVRAVANGEIVRLKVEWRGYGNAVYIRHAGGDESMYGHLQQFENDALHLTDLVHRTQERRATRYPGNIELDPPIPVSRGQIIGRSGESGSGLPHLHFEWRQNDGLEPVDPIAANLLHRSASGKVEILRVFIAADQRLRVAARTAVGQHHLGVTDLEVSVEGRLVYSMHLRRLTFETYLLGGAVFDAQLSEELKMSVYSLDPIGEKIWPGQIRASVPEPWRGRKHVSVVARALGLPAARWRGVVAAPAQAARPEVPADVRSLSTSDGEFRLELRGGTLHPETRVALVSRGPGRIAIVPEEEPPRPGARLIFRPADASLGSTTGIYRDPADGTRRFIGGWNEKEAQVSAPLSRFGQFEIGRDTAAPSLSAPRRDRCFYGDCFRVDVHDADSGLDADSVLFLFPDGRKVLGEVDPDRGLADVPAPPGADPAALSVRAEDQAGNVATWPR